MDFIYHWKFRETFYGLQALTTGFGAFLILKKKRIFLYFYILYYFRHRYTTLTTVLIVYLSY